MAYFETYGAAPYAAAAYGYGAPAPYTVPPMPAYGVGAVDELRWVDGCGSVSSTMIQDAPLQVHAPSSCPWPPNAGAQTAAADHG
jgi:hypothetical protein